MPLNFFHPSVRDWFTRTFPAPTPAQADAWAAIQAGHHTLIAAPTGSGKTLAAFLSAIDELVRRAAAGQLRDETHVVYVSPLKALSNDVHKNLDVPLEGILELAFDRAVSAAPRQLDLVGGAERIAAPDRPIRAMVRTGDTPQHEREQMRRKPPHILVTTPESLYLLLTSDSGRRMLRNVHSVIVDEIHALANSKRGAHLSLSLERLDALTGKPVQRIGLSATQKPIEEVARFLTGDAPCTIVDAGHVRARDLALELPRAPLEAVMSGEVWGELYDRIAELTQQHRTTLIFVNQRRAAERVARALSDRIGAQFVTSHHGSLSREHRLNAEQRLKAGQLRALVATASLELGIDIGDVELVCQLGSPRSIAAFLQRVGRAGHAVDGTPKGRLFPLSRDDLVECVAILDAVRRGELDRLIIPQQPIDVLAQQLVAEAACRECDEDELYELTRRSHTYRNLTREAFDRVVRMLAEGYTTRRGRHRHYIHRDAVNKKLRARRGAKLTAVTCGGTIPDNGDYDVVMEPQGIRVGTVNEDFAIESMAGDIFQLGNTSYRILRVEQSAIRVEDAQGQPPSIPFWLGEGLGRTDELSAAVARLREEVAGALNRSVPSPGTGEGQDGGESHDRPPSRPSPFQVEGDDVLVRLGLNDAAIAQLTAYLATGYAALGAMPSMNTIVLERFFDEAGDMHMVVHAPFGSRLNRAWGLALRKRFCRKFNFELQAAATEDAIILSLGATHSFPLEEAARYLNANTVRHLLIQALLDAPMFAVRWRWNASTALAVPRFRGGKKIPAQLQRMDAEDLVAVVFPDQLACFENIQGEREVPDHPLVNQTIEDCLTVAMDIDGLEKLLTGIEQGTVRIVARDLLEPSPFAQEILSARPYAFLDDAPLEERRTRAVQSRRWIDPQEAADLGRLDDAAIARVREEAWPSVSNVDELHDALMLLGCMTREELGSTVGGEHMFTQLVGQKRSTGLLLPPQGEGWDGDGGGVDSVPRQPHPHPNPRQPLPALPYLVHPCTRRLEGEGMLYVAAERLPQLLAIYPHAQLNPKISAPPEYAAKCWDRADALREIVRGRIEGLGPVTAVQLADALRVGTQDIDIALIALEQEGFVMRGKFTDGARTTEWCERRLLARIHRYTLNRLRAEIEPVTAQDFMRFLLRWQRVAPEQQGEGAQALISVIEQLEGFDAPAVAWEGDILPARVRDYVHDDLDGLCVAGRVAWARLHPPAGGANGPVRSTPVAILPRKSLHVWRCVGADPCVRPDSGDSALSSRAQAIADVLAQRGASFFDDLLQASGMLRTQVEDALAELVANGLVNSDSFAGLRALLLPQDKRRSAHRGRRRGHVIDIEDAGRWNLLTPHPGPLPQGEREKTGVLPPLPSSETSAWMHEAGQRREQLPTAGAREIGGDNIDLIARVLLRRYGVVFRKVLEREPDLPPWRDLLMIYRRMEARGELRGGRFVQGFAGEQFALPDAVSVLRDVRRAAKNGETISLSAADPLNMAGILTPGARVPALASNRVLFRDGVPIAAQVGGEVVFLERVDPQVEWDARTALLRRRMPAATSSPPVA